MVKKLLTENLKSVLDSFHALVCTGNPPCELFTHNFATLGGKTF